LQRSTGMEQADQERIKRALLEGNVKGAIDCARAIALASELDVPVRQVGEVADELGVKIVRCQLGCFGWN